MIGISFVRRILIFLAIFFGFSILLSGCTLSAKSVKLHTKEEMQKILDERYGDAEFVSMEKLEEKHQLIYTFRDKKYGFTYTATSHPHSVGMDGSTFCYDGASIYFGYEEPFLAYFMEQEKENFARQGIKLCDEVKLLSNVTYPMDKKFSLKDKTLLSTSEQYEADAKFVWERVHAYKEIPETTRGYELKVYNSQQSQFLGTYKAEGFVTAETQRIEYYMQQAKQLGKIQGEIQYLRTEKKKISELGLMDQNFYDQRFYNGADGKVNVYYFSYEGKEYYIIDEWVAQLRDDEEDGGGGIFQYYQNYKYYRISK
ncbi:MAG: hypothetical protein II477_07515 [Lachnospiraceae bacterium]|nr:hypothetical protein [Lachnospiraceae bacterium]